MTDTTGRRAFLSRAAKITLGVAAAAALPAALAGPASAATQYQWRFCEKCYGLFYEGNATTGRCPAGDAHIAQGYHFILFSDVPESGTEQANWRQCAKCYGMFWRGYPTDGVCPAGDGHDATGDNITLQHDAPPTPPGQILQFQDNWRFCAKCFGLFFFGYSTSGRCPAGNEHKIAGYNFQLGHGSD